MVDRLVMCRSPWSWDHRERVLPRGWDHPVSSDGTTRRVAPWGLITSGIRSVHVSGLAQLTDEVIGQVVVAVRPVRVGGHGRGRAWEALEAEREQISKWVGKDLSVVKIADLLARRGGAGALPHGAPVLHPALRVKNFVACNS